MNLPRLHLARLPTPIQKLKHTSLALKKDVYIWRDDLTGCVESGNKVRKLEYLLAEALQQGCDWVVTCGGPQSNHTRATSAMARQLGLGVTIITAPPLSFDRTKTPTSNLMLNRIFGAEIVWVEQAEYQKAGAVYDSFLMDEAEKLKSKGKKPYVIPLGGSNAVGVLGYRYGVKEMLQTWNQNETQAPNSVFCALGSAGTFVGLQFGIQEQQLAHTHLYGINVIGPIETAEKYRASVVAQSERKYSVKLNMSHSHVIDGHWGSGYAVATDADIQFYLKIAREEGILLDPCYTGKAFQGMLREIQANPADFGDKILFLHSGGTFGNFAYAEQYQKMS